MTSRDVNCAVGWGVGMLAVSRALGDHRGFKEQADFVTAEPDFQQLIVRDDDQFVVMCCDGVWDVLQDQEVADFVAAKVKLAFMENESMCLLCSVGWALCVWLVLLLVQYFIACCGLDVAAADRKSANAIMDQVARQLVNRALELESTDNITVMIVKL